MTAWFWRWIDRRTEQLVHQSAYHAGLELDT